MQKQALQQRSERLNARIEALAKVSEHPEFLCRTFLTDACHQANDLVLSWLNKSDLEGWVDNIGNLRIRHKNHQPDKNSIVMGSHLDTVINGGKYDGILGFLLGLDQLERLSAMGQDATCQLEVVGFANEEATRYDTEYLGSRVIAGTFESSLLEIRDREGIPLKQAIACFGGDIKKLGQDKIAQHKVLCYFEPHIEQGPVLESAGLPVGVVSGIAGKIKARMTFNGMPGHAGTVPMNLRQDALMGICEFLSAVEALAGKNQDDLVATVGQMEVKPGSTNVIPGQCSISMDIRSLDNQIRDDFFEEVRKLALAIAHKRRLTVSWDAMERNSALPCDEKLCDILAKAISANGIKAKKISSGAGHDAVAMAAITPMTMLFIRCRGGLSHHPDEYVSPEDIAVSIQVCDSFVDNLNMTSQENLQTETSCL